MLTAPSDYDLASVDAGDHVDLDALSPEAYGRLLDYLHGDCFPLAAALHRRTGLPLYVLLDDASDYGGTVLSQHAMVRLPDGRYMDALGIRSKEGIENEYPIGWHAVFAPTDLDGLHTWSEIVTEAEIDKAASFLDSLPDHPWSRYDAERGGSDKPG